MDTFLFWLQHLLLLFIYVVVVYRLFLTKGKRYHRENIGLLVISLVQAFTLRALHPAEKFAIAAISLVLLLLILRQWRQQRKRQQQDQQQQQ